MDRCNKIPKKITGKIIYNNIKLTVKIFFVILFCWHGINSAISGILQGEKPRCEHVMDQILADEIRFAIMPQIRIVVICICIFILVGLMIVLLNKKLGKKNFLINIFLVTLCFSLVIYTILDLRVMLTKDCCNDNCRNGLSYSGPDILFLH